MSILVQIPWNYNREEEQTIVRAEMLKTVLRNICSRHRFFQHQWQQQSTGLHYKTWELVKEMADNNVFSTNRKEQISIALHCLTMWLNKKNCNQEEYNQILQVGPDILTQLESKSGNRYLHDIRTYRYKQLLKINKGRANNISVRCYLIESHTLNLDYSYHGPLLSTRSEEYNFSEIKSGKLIN